MIRQPAVAGFFYPADPNILKRQINALLEIAQPNIKIDSVNGLVVPHAGYQYSGKTAAFGFNLLKNKKYKTVIILSPSHREYFPGVSIYNGDAYETPLGIVEIDNEIAQKLETQNQIIFRGIEGHRDEHAIEVEIPFLQTVLKNFKIVPIVMGDQSKIFIDTLAEKLAEIIRDDILIVTSSDLSHYYPHTIADKLDSRVEECINKFDYRELEESLNSRKCEACGGGLIVSMLKAFDLANKGKAKVLYRNDSSEASGNTTEVVGYLSAAVYH